MSNQSVNVKMMVYAAIFAALMIIGAKISIKVDLATFTLSNFFLLLAGLFLGWRWGLASVGLYILLGAIGLPVFTGGGGIGYFAGKFGGFLIGFIPAIAIVGFFAEKFKYSILGLLSGLIIGSLVIYLIGVPWLAAAAKLSLPKAMYWGMFLYLPWDGLKIAAAFGIVKGVQKMYPELIPVLNNN
jgi:biotin transport system substrate-specific component